MKIKFLIISALLLCSMSVSAQYRDYAVGLKMGPSWNWMSSGQETTVNNQTLVSFNYGLVVDKFFAERFAISSGLMVNHVRGNYDFHSKRSTLDGVMTEYEVNVHRNLKATYLCLPVLLKVKLVDLGAVCCYVQGGVDLGFRLNAQAKDAYLIGVYHQNDEDYSDARKEFKMFHSSFDLGLGTEYKVTNSIKVFGQFVYNRALTNLTSFKYSKDGGCVLLPNYFAFEFGVLF